HHIDRPAGRVARGLGVDAPGTVSRAVVGVDHDPPAEVADDGLALGPGGAVVGRADGGDVEAAGVMLVLGPADQGEHVQQLAVEGRVVGQDHDQVADGLGDRPALEDLAGGLSSRISVTGLSQLAPWLVERITSMALGEVSNPPGLLSTDRLIRYAVPFGEVAILGREAPS